MGGKCGKVSGGYRLGVIVCWPFPTTRFPRITILPDLLIPAYASHLKIRKRDGHCVLRCPEETSLSLIIADVSCFACRISAEGGGDAACRA